MRFISSQIICPNVQNDIIRIDWTGERCEVSCGVTEPDDHINMIIHGEVLATPSTLVFRDPSTFRAGELHRHVSEWQQLADDHPAPKQAHVLTWIREKVSVFDYFTHFQGTFKGNSYDSDR